MLQSVAVEYERLVRSRVSVCVGSCTKLDQDICPRRVKGGSFYSDLQRRGDKIDIGLRMM